MADKGPGGGTGGPIRGRGGRRDGPPAIAITAPRTSHPGRVVVYRARVAGRTGPVGGTVTFSVDGRPVRGCARVPLGEAASLEVTCTLSGGFATPGNRVVVVTYSGSARYHDKSTRLLEHVLPDWSGYWVVLAGGTLDAYGGARHLAAAAGRGSRPEAAATVAAAMDPDAGGLWLLSSSGDVTGIGATRSYGSAGKREGSFTGLAPTIDGKGYWLLAKNGRVDAFGDARTFGGTRQTRATGAFVAIDSTPDGRGYWLLSTSGTVVARGDARLYPGPALSGRLGRFVSIATSENGRGYWLLSASGTVHAFGDAPRLGSAPRRSGGPAFVGLVPTADHRGYWLLETNGTVLHFGDAPNLTAAAPHHARSDGALAIAGT